MPTPQNIGIVNKNVQIISEFQIAISLTSLLLTAKVSTANLVTPFSE